MTSQSPARWLNKSGTYVAASFAILLIDLFTGRFVMFPILFVLPVVAAAWFHSPLWAYSLACLLPAARFVIAVQFESADPPLFTAVNAIIRVAVLVFLAYLVARTARQTHELEKEVRLLEGILPICVACKRIQDGKDRWQSLELYLQEHTDAGVSHGMCPDCHRAMFARKQ